MLLLLEKFWETVRFAIAINREFEEHNIETNEEDREACYKLSGDTMVPITTADDQSYVLGFDKAKLDEMLNS